MCAGCYNVLIRVRTGQKPEQGEDKPSPLLCLRSGFPTRSSIVGAMACPVFSPQVSIRVRVEKPGGRPQARSGYRASLSRGFSNRVLRPLCVLNTLRPGQCGANTFAWLTGREKPWPDARRPSPSLAGRPRWLTALVLDGQSIAIAAAGWLKEPET